MNETLHQQPPLFQANADAIVTTNGNDGQQQQQDQQRQQEVEQAQALADAQQLVDQQWSLLSEHLKMMDVAVAGAMPLSEMLEQNMALVQASSAAFYDTQNQHKEPVAPPAPPVAPLEHEVNVLDMQQLGDYMDKVLLHNTEHMNKILQGTPSSIEPSAAKTQAQEHNSDNE